MEKKSDNRSFVYLLRCCDGSYYAGWTNDPEKRAKAHNSGKGAKYTKSRRPVELVYVEECEDKSTGLRREAALKKMTHAQKEAMASAYLKETDH